jgi:hypothetical protein
MQEYMPQDHKRERDVVAQQQQEKAKKKRAKKKKKRGVSQRIKRKGLLRSNNGQTTVKQRSRGRGS